MQVLGVIIILVLCIGAFFLKDKEDVLFSSLANKTSREEKNKDVAFSNALYVCKNPQCTRKFFRIYQVLEQLKYGTGSINDYRSLSLTYERKLVITSTIGSFEKHSLFICPTCHKNDVEGTKEFDWMKDAPDFPRLSYPGLKAFRREFENRKASGSEKIKELEKIIEEKEGLEAFQWQYKLDSSFVSSEKEFDTVRSAAEEDILKMKEDITERLTVLQEETPFLKEKTQIAELIKRVMTTAEDRYKKQSSLEKIV